MARWAAAHADCRSAIARERASISVARSDRRAASAGLTCGPACRGVLAASCCASTDLLSQPRAIRRRYWWWNSRRGHRACAAGAIPHKPATPPRATVAGACTTASSHRHHAARYAASRGGLATLCSDALAPWRELITGDLQLKLDSFTRFAARSAALSAPRGEADKPCPP